MAPTPRRTAYADKSEAYQKQRVKDPTGLCGEPGCTRKHFTHDLCNMHWLQYRRKNEEANRDDDPLKPEPTLKDDLRWRPEWQRKLPRKLKTVRANKNKSAAASKVVWETTATNRAATIIAKRRFTLASILQRLGDPFLLVTRGPESTVLQKADEEIQFSVPTIDWDAFIRGEWIGAPAGSNSYTTTDLGDEQLAKYANGAK